jgi:chitodextrinase
MAYGSATPVDGSMVTQHSVMISGLSPATQYHYRVRSADGFYNVAYSDDHTFETQGVDLLPPQIFSLELSSVTDSAATISWSTDEPATSQVNYGLAPDSYDWSVVDTLLNTSHSLDLVGLSPVTQYHFSVRSQDAAGNSGASPDSTFTTKHETPGQPSKPIHYDD